MIASCFLEQIRLKVLSLSRFFATYGCAFGQLVNFTKLSISFSANVHASIVCQIYETLDVNAIENHGAYPELSSYIGRKKKVVFNYIRDKVQQRLQGWHSKMLSRAGKEILLKTVAYVMPNYAMNVYLLPLDSCKELEVMMNSFYWAAKAVVVGEFIE